jgi:hypothetical protein
VSDPLQEIPTGAEIFIHDISGDPAVTLKKIAVTSDHKGKQISDEQRRIPCFSSPLKTLFYEDVRLILPQH